MENRYSRALLALCLFFSLPILGQNLVINPGFELTSSNCSNPFGEGFTTDLLNWDDANSGADSCSSPDLFSACNLFVTNMPNSVLGYQQSHGGTRHAGIITYAPGLAAGCSAVGNDQYREYIQGRLSSPLTAGQTYCVAFYVSLANNVAWATNNLGVRFFNSNYQRNACPSNSLINLTPQLNYTCAPITDTTNWVRLQWNYTATGGEQYFIIGNFFNNAGTSVGCNNSSAGALNPYGYYYIDDVSVTPGTCCYADIKAPAVLCSNAAALTLTATAGLGAVCNASVSGTWSGAGITNPATGAFNPASAGLGAHTVSFTASCGYTATANVTVNFCLTVCRDANGNLTASNGTAPYNWQSISTYTDCSGCPGGNCIPFFCPGVVVSSWVNFATNTSSVTPPSSFPIRVIDNTGATYTITSLASVPNCTSSVSCPTITASVSSFTNVNCNGASTGSATVNASGGAGPYTYTWSPGNLNGASQTGLAAGVYTVSTRDANSCPGTLLMVTISQPPAVGATLAGSTPAGCGQSNGTATLNVSGGTGPYSYTWTPGNGNLPVGNNLAAGNYSVTIRDAKGCILNYSLAVTSTGGPTVSVSSQTNVNCFGAGTGTASVNASGGSGPYSYTWTPGNLAGSSQTALAAGQYTITASDAGGCTGSTTLSITQPSSALSVTVASAPTSCNQSIGSATVSSSGGTGPYSYTWTPSGGNGPTASGLAAGSYTATVTDSKGCQQSSGVLISSAGGPTLTVSSQTNVNCYGNSTGAAAINAIGGSGSYTFSWSPGGNATSTATNLPAGTYTVAASDAGGCMGYTTVTISQAPVIVVSITTASASCAGNDGSATASANGGSGSYTYTWSNATSGPSNTALAPGNYTVTVGDANGCSQSAVAIIGSNNSGIVVDAGIDAGISPGGSTTLSGTAPTGSTYSWSPASSLSCANCQNPVASPGQTTTYTLTATSSNGCTSSDIVTVYVEEPCGQLFIPSAFSPNDDGQNDVLYVMGDCITNLQFAIFDRWGEKVFETTDPMLGWDGRFNGKKMNPATFAYYLSATVNGQELKQHGNITLVR